MKQYNDDFLNCLDDIHVELPSSSKKEVEGTYDSVMKKIGLKRKKPALKRSARIILIAAAVLACTVVTAAASSFRAGDIFKGFFESNKINPVGENSSVVSLSESQVAKINDTGIMPDYTATNNGTTIQVLAITGDKSCAYIYIDAIVPKEVVLDKKEYEFEEMPIEFNQNDEDCGSISWDIKTLKDENPNDNKKSFVIRISSAGMDMQNRNIKLTLKNLAIPGKKLTCHPIINGEWAFDLKLDYTTSSKKIELNKVTHFSDSAYKDMYTTIKTVNMSNLSASVDYINPKFIESKSSEICADFMAPDMIVELKDGTNYKILRGASTGNSNSYTVSYQFDAPLDFDKVEKITLGDVQIPINK